MYLLSDCPQKQCAGLVDGNYLHLPINVGLLGAFLFSVTRNCISPVSHSVDQQLFIENHSVTIKSIWKDWHINLLVTEILFHGWVEIFCTCANWPQLFKTQSQTTWSNIQYCNDYVTAVSFPKFSKVINNLFLPTNVRQCKQTL